MGCRPKTILDGTAQPKPSSSIDVSVIAVLINDVWYPRAVTTTTTRSPATAPLLTTATPVIHIRTPNLVLTFMPRSLAPPSPPPSQLTSCKRLTSILRSASSSGGKSARLTHFTANRLPLPWKDEENKVPGADRQIDQRKRRGWKNPNCLPSPCGGEDATYGSPLPLRKNRKQPCNRSRRTRSYSVILLGSGKIKN